MIVDNELAIYDINQYLWEVVLLEYRALFTSTIADNAGLIIDRPFFPVQQTPESVRGPHFVYTTRTIPGLDLWQTSTDEILYRCYGRSIDEATVLSNAIVRKLRKFDESAAPINAYLKTAGRNDFHFLYTQVLGNNSPNAIRSEDGLWGRPVWVRTHYVENQF